MVSHVFSKRTSIKTIVFSLYILFLILLPTGSLAGVNLKIVVFVPLFIISLQLLAKEEGCFSQFAFLSAVAGIFMMWGIQSLMNPVYAEWAMSQYKDVITTFLGCLFIRLFTKEEADRRAFVRLCIYTVAFGCLLKVLVLLYAARTGASVSDIVDRVSGVFRVKLMTMSLEDLGGRLQFPSDNILPIVLFAILCLRRKLDIGGLKAFLIVALFLISSVFTFSRYIWASTAFALCLGMIVSRKDKLHLVYLAGITAVSAYFYGPISVLMDLRFSSALAAASDKPRVWQIVALKKFFWDAPIFGHGMGSYVVDHIRSVELPYAYEVQLLSLSAEFGIIGMGIFTVMLLNYYRKAFSFRKGTYSYQASVGLMLICFLGAGFFNPSLLVSMSAASYGMIFVLASLGSCKEDSLSPRLGAPSQAHSNFNRV
jgi:hypothetical protein